MTKFFQKGVSLFITAIVLSIILAIVLGLSAILIVQMRTIRSVGYSVIAIYAADSGVEQALTDIYKYFKDQTTPQYSFSSDLGNNSSYVVEIYCCRGGTGSCLLKDRPPDPEDEELGDIYYPNSCPFLPPGDDCQGSYFCIRSVGTYKETKRAIEVKI